MGPPFLMYKVYPKDRIPSLHVPNLDIGRTMSIREGWFFTFSKSNWQVFRLKVGEPCPFFLWISLWIAQWIGILQNTGQVKILKLHVKTNLYNAIQSLFFFQNLLVVTVLVSLLINIFLPSANICIVHIAFSNSSWQIRKWQGRIW